MPTNEAEGIKGKVDTRPDTYSAFGCLRVYLLLREKDVTVGTQNNAKQFFLNHLTFNQGMIDLLLA